MVSKAFLTSIIGAFIFDNLLMILVSFVDLLFLCIYLPLIFAYPLNVYCPFKRAKYRRRLNSAPNLRGRRYTALRLGLLFHFFSMSEG